ncbi:MAG: DUF3604 domain-containing protein, partial [Acidobacteria bacterium]|nr:DUF3604 domain-containing protein [Acidobacteriota bacterium]
MTPIRRRRWTSSPSTTTARSRTSRCSTGRTEAEATRHTMHRRVGRSAALVVAALAASCSNAPDGAETPEASGTPEEAAPAAVSAPVAATEEVVAAPHERAAFFGDLHVHTSWSLDAYSNGNRDDPAAAYRYGRGEALLNDDGSVGGGGGGAGGGGGGGPRPPRGG